MFKKTWEGMIAGRMNSNTVYLSGKGVALDSVKTATEYMETRGYAETDCVNIKKLQSLLCKSSNKNRDDWIDDLKTLPKGWKKRITAKDNEYFLRPNGEFCVVFIR